MKIKGIYSFNKGAEYVESNYPHLLKEVKESIVAVDAEACKTKKSKEKTMKDKLLYSPKVLNKSFKQEFESRGWKTKKVKCEYSTEYYTEQHDGKPLNRGQYRSMDFLKDKVGIEIQFGKYSFMVYNVAAKMTIFNNLGFIDCGIEIVPIKEFADDMSTGVSYFEQFVWDLEKRGVSNIDIPVLILGIG